MLATLTIRWGVGRMIRRRERAGAPRGIVPEMLAGVLAINSSVGVNIAATIVVSRLLYSFGRAMLFPCRAATDSRPRTRRKRLSGNSTTSFCTSRARHLRGLLRLGEHPVDQ